MASQGFVKVPRQILALTNVPATGKLILAELLDVQRRGHNWPSAAQIAVRIGISAKTVNRLLPKLRRVGLLNFNEERRGRPPFFDVSGVEMGQPVTYQPSDECGQQVSFTEGNETGQNGTSNQDSLASESRQSVPFTLSSEEKEERGPRRRHKSTPTSGPNALIAHFDSRWSAMHGGAKRPFNKSRDPVTAKRILEAAGEDLGAAKALVDAYFEDDDPFYAQQGHPLDRLGGTNALTKFVAMTAGNEHYGSGDSFPEADSRPEWLRIVDRKFSDDMQSRPEFWDWVVDNELSIGRSKLRTAARRAETPEEFEQMVRPTEFGNVG